MTEEVNGRDTETRLKNWKDPDKGVDISFLLL